MTIKDMRTQIHGITEDMLRDVKFTLRHAQAFLMKIVSERTILLGHGLFNDLKALKFDHRYV